MELDATTKNQCKIMADNLRPLDAVRREIELNDACYGFHKDLLTSGHAFELANELIRDVREEVLLRLFITDRDDYRRKRALR